MKPMINSEDIEEVGNRFICGDCIGDKFLRSEIERSGTPGRCHYCEQDSKVITIGELADEIEGAFERHYLRTPIDPEGYEWQLAKEGRWERAGEPVVFVIAEAAEIYEAPAEDVRLVLEDRHYDVELAQMGEEDPYDDDAHYAAKGPDDIEQRMEWRWFEQGIQQKSRFFSKSAMGVLDSVFSNISSLKTSEDKPVVVEAGPNYEIMAIYRARVFQSAEDLEKALVRPDRDLGPPPSHAASPGRMNPQGIAVFYGAMSEETAIAEIRPPVGSRVGVGRFELLRPVKLLDVAALRDVLVQGSIFDASFLRRLEHATFLERLSHRISQVVMPNDEPFDYLVTQAIAEYLSEITEPPLDGIIFGSAQMGEVSGNVVLFYPSSRVRPIELPAGTKVSARLGSMTDEGFETDYYVWEETPKPTPNIAEETTVGVTFEPPFHGALTEFSDFDDRPATLQLDLESIAVHHVLGVKQTTNRYVVSRYRHETGDEDF